MATHSIILAWKSPWTEEPGGLQSMGLHDWALMPEEGGGKRVGSNKLEELEKKIYRDWCIGIFGNNFFGKYAIFLKTNPDIALESVSCSVNLIIWKV